MANPGADRCRIRDGMDIDGEVGEKARLYQLPATGCTLSGRAVRGRNEPSLVGRLLRRLTRGWRWKVWDWPHTP